ncbi:DUF6912 family protein [Yinghuangia seranimata]|uniref:DUF6912 family protein n=1 Tax=Yinghuangia seranimata TaxID=408067 RepID=UPI00248CD60B|nr:hypothetical protein [Yinghuangia seranimata]MDI2131430.1 hypothetical protein [Yinghuangia seranimata]
MRVYVPSTPAALAALHRAAAVEPAPVSAVAVTAELRAWCGTEDDEELEYAATVLAGRASLGLLAGEEGAGPRRVVLAAEVPDGIVSEVPDLGPGAVLVDGTVPLKRVASIHMDAADAEPAVRAALADPSDEALVEAVEEHELMWYATQELGGLVG